MSKSKTIYSFFKRKKADISEGNTPLGFNAGTSNLDEHHLKSSRVEDEEHPCGEALSAKTQEIHFKLEDLP